MSRPDRRLVIGGTAALGTLFLGGVGYEVMHLLGKHYPPTPYDDLLGLLPDREAAKQVGGAFVRDHPTFVAASAAVALRQRIDKEPLESLLQAEIAAGLMTEAGYWVLPETLAGLCALAAKTG